MTDYTPKYTDGELAAMGWYQFIAPSDAAEDELEKLSEKLKKMVHDNGGFLCRVEEADGAGFVFGHDHGEEWPMGD